MNWRPTFLSFVQSFQCSETEQLYKDSIWSRSEGNLVFCPEIWGKYRVIGTDLMCYVHMIKWTNHIIDSSTTEVVSVCNSTKAPNSWVTEICQDFRLVTNLQLANPLLVARRSCSRKMYYCIYKYIMGNYVNRAVCMSLCSPG